MKKAVCMLGVYFALITTVAFAEVETRVTETEGNNEAAYCTYACVVKDDYGWKYTGYSSSKTLAIKTAIDSCLKKSRCAHSCNFTHCYID